MEAVIDVGAYSSRPGAAHVPEEEELSRILPMVDLLLKEFPQVLLSIDTFRSKVARKCIEAGATLINDISAGGMDPEMITTIGQLKVPYVMMHMRGTPQTSLSIRDSDLPKPWSRITNCSKTSTCLNSWITLYW